MSEAEQMGREESAGRAEPAGRARSIGFTQPAGRAESRPALALALICTVGFLVLAWAAVPWDPVPGGPVEPVAATDVFTAKQIAAGEAYSRVARWLGWIGLAISLATTCLVGFTRWGARLVSRVPGPWWVQALAGVLLVHLLVRWLTLPVSGLAQRHRLLHGLSTQGWSEWARDLVVSEVISVVVTWLALLVVLGCARRWRTWWTWLAGGAVAALVVLGSFVYPVLVEPLFNSFEPLAEGPLRTEIFELADREGVVIEDVLVADASRRTTTLNAYVSGLWGSRRVVVYDTLVEDLPQDQALSVVAHELAHARHDDVLLGTGLGALGSALGVAALGLLLRRRAADASSVPRILALVAVATLMTAPVESGISRRIETRADVDALTATRDAEAFERMQVRLAVRALADPTPPRWAQIWWGSHPATLERIAVARGLGQGLP